MLLQRRRVIQIAGGLVTYFLVSIAQVGTSEITGVHSMTEVSDIPLNTAVCWNGTRFGLLATIPEEAERIVEKGDVVVSTLLAAMADPSRFVMAHVLLTRMTGVQYESFPSWNGLKVDLQAQGKVSIDSDQRHKLARRWQLYFRTEPRPDKLPSSN